MKVQDFAYQVASRTLAMLEETQHYKIPEELRKSGFDVKNDGIDNASSFNYDQTLVASRTKDMRIARQVGKALDLDKDRVLLMRDGQERFDVTVIVGSDLQGRLP